MKTEEIENLTIVEINAMIDGWTQRYYDAQDLFIMFSAMPVYNVNCRKPPKYEDFVKNRDKKTGFEDMSYEELLAFASDDEMK